MNKFNKTKLIFGQQDYVERVKQYLEKISSQDKLQILYFPLTDPNPAEYVFNFSFHDKDLDNLDKDIPVILAFGKKYQNEAGEYLRKYGFTNICPFDATLDNDWKKEYFKKTFLEQHMKFSLIEEEKSVVVYMAKSVVDKPLKNYPQNLSSHIVPIQVGAALTDKKIAEVTDDIGDNISERNRHFSETTALYWMWKNAKADYLGLCHYRRLWKDLDFIAGNLQNDTIDVVLPLPTLCVHSLYEDHLERCTPKVYPVMMNVLKGMSPEYYEASKKIYRGHVLYACNMLIAKRQALHELCQWMFPIVFEVENRIGNLHDPYLNRYAGFCTEQLITLYFLYNKQNWLITHAEKIFIE